MERLHAHNAAEDDPLVLATVARLRASVLASGLCSAAFFVLALIGMYGAWQFGLGQSGADALDFKELLFGAGLLFSAFMALAVMLVIVVRAPYRRAQAQAIELLEANHLLASTTLETFAALSAAVEAKDRFTAGHGLRVTLISILIGQELELSSKDLDTLRHAATFHDIGKIAVPDHVLANEGRLSASDYEAMKVHPVEGARICAKLKVLASAVALIRHHHERMDGRGYPDGLKGDEIPLGARIIAVADAWDAITSDRPYRLGQPAFVALEEIRRCTGAQFDERVVRAFIEVLAKDPWMFGLTPTDIAQRRPLPAPIPLSRGVDDSGETSKGSYEEPSLVQGFAANDEIDWSQGFNEEDLRAA